MKKNILLLTFSFCVLAIQAQKKPAHLKTKQKLIQSVDSKFEQLTTLSDKIWAFEE